MNWPWSKSKSKLRVSGVRVFLRREGAPEEFFFIEVPPGCYYTADSWNDDKLFDKGRNLLKQYRWQAGYTIIREFVYRDEDDDDIK